MSGMTEQPKRKRGRPRKNSPPIPEPEDKLRAQLHEAFTAGLRYALARWWDNIEVGGNMYILEQAFQDVLRCECGQEAPSIIDTNRGERVAWESEFDMLRRRFGRRSDLSNRLRERKQAESSLAALPARPLSPNRPKKTQVEWKDI